MAMCREDVPSALWLMMISDENEDQFYQFFIFQCLDKNSSILKSDKATNYISLAEKTMT